MTELIKDYYDKPVGEYLNRTVTINNVELACDIYKVAPETVLTPAVFTGCTAVDANTQIVIGRDMSVASGTTLIPPYRCKGIVIGDVGTFTNEGTISMTARGASGAGKNIQLTADYMISAVGGTGGAGANNYPSGTNFSNGKNGDSPAASVLSCGGGGSGGAGHISAAAGHSGVGGTGTSFSGGAGSGGSIGTTSSAGSSSGGAGSNGLGGGSDGYNATGGAGNPSGTSTGSRVGTGGNGTGGLIIILANNLVQSGSLIANGIQAAGIATTTGYIRDVTGGSSGGGCIVLISKTRTITGTNSVAGGIAPTGGNGNGGAGGAGAYASYIVEDLILQNLPVEFAITDKAHLDNIEPSEAVRFIGLTDDDELQYDIMGTRHRAMNTDVDLSVIKVPGQRTPDEFEVVITNPQEGQVMRYNATDDQWENGGDYHVYSTDERVVGKWVDGKPIYEKTIIGGHFTAKGDFTVNHNISNLDEVVYVSNPVWYDNIDNNWGAQARLCFSGSVSSSYAIGGKVMITSTQLNINNESGFAAVDWSNRTEKIRITIQYTKTTDTV